MWPSDFVRDVRDLCSRHSTLMIVDEVLTGFGRTGKLFACEHANVTPDIICLSKGLAGGYMPARRDCTTSAIYDAFLSDDRAKTFFHGHSYTANPLACAVGLASLKLFEEEPVLVRVARIESQMRDGLEPLRSLDHVADVRVIGGVGVVELEGGGYLDQLGPKLAAEFLKRRYIAPTTRQHRLFHAAYVISEDETDVVLAKFARVINSVA